MKLLTRLFSCRHRNIGTPVTVTEDGVTTCRAYCPDCNSKVDFDPQQMLVIGRAA